MNLETNTWQVGESKAPLPPLVPGAPIIGNALSLAADSSRFLVGLYQEYGPIFRIRIFNQIVTVLAGLEANRFAAQQGRDVFTNHDVFIDLVNSLGSPKNMAALEGEEHKFFRSTAHNGYSRAALAAAMPKIVDVITNFLAHQKPGAVFDVFPTFQRLISLQLGRVAADFYADDDIDELQRFMRYLMNVYLAGAWPRFVLNFPSYKNAQRNAHEFARKVVAHHQANPPSDNRPRDLIDDFLQAHNENPERMPMNAVHAAALGPFLAGQDTVAGTSAFMLYAIISNPEIYAPVQKEVDVLFANGIPAAADFRNAEALHNTAIETMRRYPVAPFMPQHVSQSFEFHGYRIERGQPVYVAQSLTHFMPEYFEDPFTFNIDRPKPKAQTFAPFGVGPHTCIGAGMGELQIMLHIAALLHQAKYSMEPANYQLKTKTLPPAPAKFRLKIVEKRIHGEAK